MSALSFLAGDLRAAVMIAARFNFRRWTIPALECVLIESGEAGAVVRVTDLDDAISVPVAASGSGAFAVSARQLSRLLNLIPRDTEIEIFEHAKGGVFISWPGARYALSSLPHADFCFERPLSKITDLQIVCDPSEFRRALGVVSGAISTEETRYYLNGACLTTLAGNLSLVATDGHRLSAWRLTNGSPIEGGKGYIIPRQTVRAIVGCKAIQPKRIHLMDDQSIVVFECAGGIEIIATLIDGVFPDVARVIPKAPAVVFEVPIVPLAAALRRLSAVVGGSDRSRAASMAFEGGALRIAPQTSEARGSFETVCEVDNLDSFVIGFNAGYLLQMLAEHKAAGAETVKFQFSDGASPALIERDRLRSVIMPLRTSYQSAEYVEGFDQAEAVSA